MKDDKIEALLANKGYGSDAIRNEIAKAEFEAVIPAKRWRRDATRYDKTKESQFGFVAFASINRRTHFAQETQYVYVF
jgi:hypothetical protein